MATRTRTALGSWFQVLVATVPGFQDPRPHPSDKVAHVTDRHVARGQIGILPQGSHLIWAEGLEIRSDPGLTK